MNKYKRCKRGRDKKTMPVPDFPKIGKFVYFSPRHGKAKKGSWMTRSEWSYDENKKILIPVCVKTEYVDGEKIKEDTWYTLKDGELVEDNKNRIIKMNKPYVDALLICIVLFPLISFIRYLMIFFQKKRIEGALDLVYREKLYDKNAVRKISDKGLSAEIYSRKKIGDFLLNDKGDTEK